MMGQQRQQASVAEYLARLRAEADRRLPAEEARDLVADIEEHLDAVTEGAAGDAAVRTAIDRLGTPSEVVDAAVESGTAADGTGSPLRARFAERDHTSLALGLLITAELAVLPMAFIPPALLLVALVWLAGVALTLAEHRWSALQKVAALMFVASGAIGFPLALVPTARVSVSECSSVTTSTTDPAGQVVTGSGACQEAGGTLWWVVAAFALYAVLHVTTIVWLARHRDLPGEG